MYPQTCYSERHVVEGVEVTYANACHPLAGSPPPLSIRALHGARRLCGPLQVLRLWHQFGGRALHHDSSHCFSRPDGSCLGGSG